MNKSTGIQSKKDCILKPKNTPGKCVNCMTVLSKCNLNLVVIAQILNNIRILILFPPQDNQIPLECRKKKEYTRPYAMHLERRITKSAKLKKPNMRTI